MSIGTTIKNIKNFVKQIVPSIDELASIMAPDNMGNLFEPVRETNIEELERRYFGDPLTT